MRSIAVVGTGHGGLAAAADLALRGHRVRIQGRSAERIQALRQSGGITVEGVVSGFAQLEMATTNVAQCIAGADIIMVVLPMNALKEAGAAIALTLQPHQVVFLNPGLAGGALIFMNALRQAGYAGPCQLCEAGTLTYVARAASHVSVNIYSYSRNVGFAAMPSKLTDALHLEIALLYPEVVKLGSVLESMLNSRNAIHHTPIIVLNAGWIEHTGGDFLYYREGMTSAVGNVAAALDAERMRIAQALGVPCRSFLEQFYKAGVTTQAAFESGSISEACRQSAPNASIKAPTSLQHRYIFEDVAYGLGCLSEIGRLVGVPTPTINAMIHIASQEVGVDLRECGVSLDELGIEGMTAEDLLTYCQEGTPARSLARAASIPRSRAKASLRSGASQFNGIVHAVATADDRTGDLKGQSAQALRKIEALLQEHGSNRRSILTVAVHLADIGAKPLFEAAWEEWVSPAESEWPMRSVVGGALPAGILVEIVATGAVAPRAP